MQIEVQSNPGEAKTTPTKSTKSKRKKIETDPDSSSSSDDHDDQEAAQGRSKLVSHFSVRAHTAPPAHTPPSNATLTSWQAP